MHYTYVLRSLKNGRLYYGSTSDLKRRLTEHNSKIGGRYSKKNAPFKLIYYEAYKDKRDASRGKKFIKSGYGREVIKDKLKYSLSV